MYSWYRGVLSPSRYADRRANMISRTMTDVYFAASSVHRLPIGSASASYSREAADDVRLIGTRVSPVWALKQPLVNILLHANWFVRRPGVGVARQLHPPSSPGTRRNRLLTSATFDKRGSNLETARQEGRGGEVGVSSAKSLPFAASAAPYSWTHGSGSTARGISYSYRHSPTPPLPLRASLRRSVLGTAFKLEAGQLLPASERTSSRPRV